MDSQKKGLCCVPGCYYLKRTKAKVSVFRSQSSEQLEVWSKALGQDLPSTSRICSRHFLENEVIRVYPTVPGLPGPPFERGRPILSPTAAPTLLLGGASSETHKKPINTEPRPREKAKKIIKNKLAKTAAKSRIRKTVDDQVDEKLEAAKCVKTNKRLRKTVATAVEDPVDEILEAVKCVCPEQNFIFIPGSNKLTMDFYEARLAGTKFPSTEWKKCKTEHTIYVAHARNVSGQTQADKVLVLREGLKPRVLFNGVRYMDIDPDVDLTELLKEIDDTKACLGKNIDGFCSGVNRSQFKTCLLCRFANRCLR